MIVGAFWHASLEESYARAFEGINWKVVRFDWEEHALAHPLRIKALTNKLLRNCIADRTGKLMSSMIEDARPDLVIVIKGRFISPETLREAKRILRDRPLVNFNPDSPWDHANGTPRLLSSIAEYDAHFTWNKQLLHKFTDAGAKQIHYLPFAYDPILHHPLQVIPPEPSYDAVFIGTYSTERDRILGSVEGCTIAIAGNGWQRARVIPKEWIISSAVYGEDSLGILAAGRCAINLLRPQNCGSHNMRTFEIPASAFPMLTTRSEEQSEMFVEGSEMECFENVEELSKKIIALRSNHRYAQGIARNGRERAREETYEKRSRHILERLGISWRKG